jgi:nitrogen regulatory protein PII
MHTLSRSDEEAAMHEERDGRRPGAGPRITIDATFLLRGFGRQKGHTDVVSAARPGSIGDGKVFITALDEAVRMHTGESGEAAL